MSSLLVRNVEVDGAVADVAVVDNVVRGLRSPVVGEDSETLDGSGCTLLPGLWDHHIHLHALATAQRSIAVGPPDVTTGDGFVATLREADARLPPGEWLRAVGYHESVAGDLDRAVLDGIIFRRPVRVQHRSGALWVLNSSAVDVLEVDRARHVGIERTATGVATGRLFDADEWLRGRTGGPPNLADVGHLLASFGVVGVTDMTPYSAAGEFDALIDARRRGDLPQRLMVTGGPPLVNVAVDGAVSAGPVKIVLRDGGFAALDEVVSWIVAAHAHDRGVAIHAVTRVSLALAVAALAEATPHERDRIEHCSVAPPELRREVARLGVTVVTQPNFVADRGDQYLEDVDPEDQPHLYPFRSLLDAGIRLAAGTDAPFGHADPWRSIAAAVTRRTASGVSLSPDQALAPRRALELFLGAPDQPAGPPRRIAIGAPADLCVVEGSVADILAEPSSDRVRATVIGGVAAFVR